MEVVHSGRVGPANFSCRIGTICVGSLNAQASRTDTSELDGRGDKNEGLYRLEIGSEIDLVLGNMTRQRNVLGCLPAAGAASDRAHSVRTVTSVMSVMLSDCKCSKVCNALRHALRVASMADLGFNV